ncbi:hypothetical protein HU200_060683 [Digitaria exilis]|uniref:NB-ARC domain-containing protein n=1 Tax=Digitaria exilis TaxID=1010633 RepID=A0A835AAC3_9POAL|nr:hypothetical protein HU200_060683 [Digitaria exilis]
MDLDDDDDDDDEDEDADEDDDYDEDHIKRKQAKEWLDEHESKLVGRMADKESLLANSRGAVRPVFGMAGVGKSYLVRYVYYKQIVTPYTSYQKFGWVDVSHPFNIRDFSWRLLLDLHSGSLQHGTMLRIRDPIQQCRQLIKKDTCLIVIDGLQTKEEWDSIKAALQLDENNVKNGSLIIVIANEKSVASHCAKHWWSVEGLEIDRCTSPLQ